MNLLSIIAGKRENEKVEKKSYSNCICTGTVYRDKRSSKVTRMRTRSRRKIHHEDVAWLVGREGAKKISGVFLYLLPLFCSLSLSRVYVLQSRVPRFFFYYLRLRRSLNLVQIEFFLFLFRVLLINAPFFASAQAWKSCVRVFFLFFFSVFPFFLVSRLARVLISFVSSPALASTFFFLFLLVSLLLLKKYER